ncbi:hypothetical protein L2E82_36031 [Cichorium intybus]|uniref:Uncharacterized protein n=1 Tax=Cichorium intybus TaxID=13427 RepID=A0ACB9BQH6_CICIN|nr:hypothetical protein L2E82_36031 [Cichorium intybus]
MTFLLHCGHLHKTRTSSTICRSFNSNGLVVIKSYMEDSNTISGFANRVIVATGGDFIDFAEFQRRVGRNASVNDSIAFIDFQDRRGRARVPLYVLMCCWLVALGAGLLKSEEILEGVTGLLKPVFTFTKTYQQFNIESTV